MARVPMKLQPGMSRPGTRYEAKGRWYDGSLVRWFEGVMQPIGGWQHLQTSAPANVNVGNPVRGAHVWRRNLRTPQVALGTATQLYHFEEGVLTEITPSVFTTGLVTAAITSGNFGTGAFGVGAFGVGDPTQDTLTEANSWQMDNYGEDLVAVALSDGQLLYWDRSVGGLAAALTNAPTQNLGVVVTPERFIVALGAGGDPKKIQWADQDDATIWTASNTNQAGDLDLATEGQIMGGSRTRSETLIWTDTALYALRFIGGVFVYTVPEIGKGGAISRMAWQVVGSKAYWMGPRGFYEYDGSVRRLPSEVADFVFNDLNRTQASKIWCEQRSQFSEVTWYYPSATSTECDRYVTFNHAMGIWYFGALERTGGVDQGVLDFPISSDADGDIYQHEVGMSYLDPDSNTLQPYAISGPVELGQGDNVMTLDDIYPDEATLGDLQFKVWTADSPTGTETENGPYTATEVINLRLEARQMRIEIEQVNPGWRFGIPRLDLQAGGMR